MRYIAIAAAFMLAACQTTDNETGPLVRASQAETEGYVRQMTGRFIPECISTARRAQPLLKAQNVEAFCYCTLTESAVGMSAAEQNAQLAVSGGYANQRENRLADQAVRRLDPLLTRACVPLLND